MYNTPYLISAVSKPSFTVLIFDSGIGGLAIYDKIQRFRPNLHYIYTFDNVAFPYGEKSEIFIVERILKIVAAVQQRYSLTLAIIACNTASTVSLPALRKKFSFPIVGVVPAIKVATRLTMNGIVGLLATRGTVRRSYTHELIARYASKCRIEMLGTPELVEIAEAKLRGNVVHFTELRRILQPWLCMAEPPDTIILGCTHFSFLQDELLAVLPDGVHLVDSSAAVACYAISLLEHKVPIDYIVRPKNAFCMELNIEVERLLPALRNYGFKTLEKLIV